MAETTINPEVVPTGFPLTKEVLVWTAADIVNGNRFTHTGKEVVLVHNNDAAAQTVTFQSVAINGRQDPLHNTAISLAIGEYAAFNFRGDGWKQPSGEDAGFVIFTASDVDVRFIVLRNPA